MFCLTDDQKAARGSSRAFIQSKKEPKIRETLKRSSRLRSRQEFLSVFDGARSQDGRVFRFGVLSIFVDQKNSSRSSGAKLGLSVAKKKLKHAHDRNQVKRWVRELFRKHRTELESTRVVVRWDGGEKDLSFSKVEENFQNFIERISKWKNNLRKCG